MIGQPTLFVLGAGASWPFGFPTSEDLRSELCTGGLTGNLQACGWPEQEARDFFKEFLYSGVKSIDAFLATRAEYHDIGLQAIAAALLPKENLNTLYRSPRDQVGRVTSDWMGHLWDRLRDGAIEPQQIARNQVSFITFNYDRSLEAFLLNCMMHTYGLNVDAAQDILSSIPVHHMYGSLGGFKAGVGFEYGAPAHPERIRRAAAKLSIVPAARQDRDSICTDLITAAARALFLGFGFDDANCTRLGFGVTKGAQGFSGPVWGTSLGMTNEQKAIAESRISPPSCRANLLPIDCLSLLCERAAMLMN